MSESEEVKTETPRAWATIKKSSTAKSGDSPGFEYGYSDPAGDTAAVLAGLGRLKMGVEALLAPKEA